MWIERIVEHLVGEAAEARDAQLLDADGVHDLRRVRAGDVDARPEEPDRQAFADAQAVADGADSFERYWSVTNSSRGPVGGAPVTTISRSVSRNRPSVDA